MNSAHPGKTNLALEARGKRVVGVWQFKTDADRAAGSIEDLIDHGYNCSVLATNFRIHLRRSAEADSSELAQRHIHFDVKRIDLRDRHEMRLIKSIFTRAQLSLDDDAVNGAADRPLLEHFRSARQLQLRQLRLTSAS